MTSRQRAARSALFLSAAIAAVQSASLAAQTASDPAPAPAPATAAAPSGAKRVYTPADFARFAPRNALDMVQQVPGFSIRQADQERGLGQASENVLLNGQRVPSKSGGAIAELQKIAASSVERIEIVDAATLEIAGLSGQVANVIAKAKKSTGQFSWRPEMRAHYADPLFTRGDVSYSGTRGALDYTLGFDSRGNRSAAGGPTTIYNPDDSVREFRDDAWRNNYDSPKLSGRFTLNRAGAGVGNLNLAFMPLRVRFDETSERDRPNGVDRVRTTRSSVDGFNYEVGGDYSFGLAGGALKLIGLRKFGREPFRSTAIFDFADDSPDVGDRFERDGRSSEWIGRAEQSWKVGSNDLQISAEAAFNTLSSATRLFELRPDGEFQEIRFPGGTGRVKEDRYEVLGTWGRPLGPTLTMQLAAGGEYSRLSSASDVAELSRSFFRPKGSLSLAWKPGDDLDVSLKVRRRVGQLNFYDFLASVNFTDDRENAGNLELVPPQSWEVDLEGNRKLGEWGTTKLRFFVRRIDDIVDIIPIGANGQSPGNIDRAIRYGVDWKNTLLFDQIGWRGAKLDTTVVLQRSRLEDPLTGESRPISNTLKREIELELRHDIPGSVWAWGGSFDHEWFSRSYRLTEVGRMWEGPIWLGAFIENKNVLGMTVRASVYNLANARSRWDRLVYAGFRDRSPLAFREDRNRLIGPIFSLSLRGNF
ncbi:MAG TPA: TonB-dependent receptor plug domain-containing protein [Sphingomicrobium sp.]|nr:TonB-dependent receptor plug domain-containing protein [Sphingomicrobium sp.]